MKGWRNARKESSEWESLPVRGEQNVCATRWLCYGKGTRVARSIETGNLIGDGIGTGVLRSQRGSVLDLPSRWEGDWRLDAVKFRVGSRHLIGVLGDGDEPRVSSLLNEHGKDATSGGVRLWIFFSIPLNAPGPVKYREVRTDEMNGRIERC